MRRSLTGRTGFNVPLKLPCLTHRSDSSSFTSDPSSLPLSPQTCEFEEVKAGSLCHGPSKLLEQPSHSNADLNPNVTAASGTLSEGLVPNNNCCPTTPTRSPFESSDTNSERLSLNKKVCPTTPSRSTLASSESHSYGPTKKFCSSSPSRSPPESPIIYPQAARSQEEPLIGDLEKRKDSTVNNIGSTGETSSNSRDTKIDLHVDAECEGDEELQCLQRKLVEVDCEISELESSGLDVDQLKIYMDKLHRYNDLKDLGQMVFSQLSMRRGVSAKEIHRLYDAPMGE